MPQRLYLFIGMLLGILVTTSCNKEEEATDGWQPGNQAIAFAVDADESFLPNAPHTSRTTRGATSTASSMTDFGISAYYSSTSTAIDASSLPNYMYNQQVTRPNNTPSWTYSPLKYWPQAGTLQFFAYSPYAATGVLSAGTTSGYPTLTYTVPAEVAQQQDLLVTNITSPLSDKKPVKLTFSHALSCMEFHAKLSKAAATGVVTKISEIQITGLKNKATYSSGPTKGWTVSTESATDNYILTPTNYSLIATNLTTTPQPLSSSTGLLMPIPQSIDTTPKIIVSTVTVKDGAVINDSKEVALNTIIPSPLAPAKKYKITIAVTPKDPGASTGGSITISYKCVDWKTAAITIPPFN